MNSSLKMIRQLHFVSRRFCTGTAEALVNIKVDDKTGYAIMELNRAPVNGLNLELLESINQGLDQLAANPNIIFCPRIGSRKSGRPILTSTSNKVFCAGLDINELIKPKTERFEKFYGALQNVYLKLYGSAFPTVALVNGHSPAGGCLLALICEYRVMLNNFTIGLNETRLGVIPPSWLRQVMVNVIGRRQGELALTLGTLFSTEEALKVGLIDAIAGSKEEAWNKCETRLNQFKKVSSDSRSITKQSLRGAELCALDENRAEDLDIFFSHIKKDHIQVGLESYLAILKKK